MLTNALLWPDIPWREITLETGIAIEDVQPLGEGWDAFVFRAREVVFKFAKRADNWDQLAVEYRVQGMLQDSLPTKTPRGLVQEGRSNAWPFGYTAQEFVEGKPFVAESSDTRSVSTQIGQALRTLHTLPLTPAQYETLPSYDRLQEAEATVEPAFQIIEDRLNPRDCGRLRSEVDRVLATPHYFEGGTALLHNDLHAEHVLMSNEGDLAIIDWADAGIGDPDIDFLPLHWSHGQAFIAPCIEAYGHEDPASLYRKLEDLGLLYSLMLITYAPKYGTANEAVGAWEDLAARL